MKTTIAPHRRQFDGRTVFIWILDDDAGRLLDRGCEISREQAERSAERAVQALQARKPRPFRVVTSHGTLDLEASDPAQAISTGLELAGKGAILVSISQAGDW